MRFFYRCGCQGFLLSFDFRVCSCLGCLVSFQHHDGGYFLKKVLDLIVLLLIHSTNTKSKKHIEKVLRNKIRLGCMPEQLMQNAFQDHAMVSVHSALGLSFP